MQSYSDIQECQLQIVENLTSNLDSLQRANIESEAELKDIDKWIRDRVNVLKDIKNDFDYLYRSMRMIKM